MKKDTTIGPPSMSQNDPSIGLLVDYAREVVREYLHAQCDEVEQEERDKMFSGFRISGEVVAKQFRKSNPDLFTEDLAQSHSRRKKLLKGWLKDPPKVLEPLAELAVIFELSFEDVEILIMAAAPAIDPTVEDLYAYVRNNVHKRDADVGFVCNMLSMGLPQHFDHYLKRCDFDSPLRRHRLVLLELRRTEEDQLDKNLVTRRIKAADRVLDFMRARGQEAMPQVDESLASVCVRLRESVEIEHLGLPQTIQETVYQLGRSRTLPVVLLGPEGAGKQAIAQSIAKPVRRGILSADLVALLNENPEILEILLAELFREARLGGDLVYLYGHGLSAEITGPVRLVLERFLHKESLVLGVDKLPIWGAEITASWPTIAVPLPDEHARLRFWSNALTGVRNLPGKEALLLVSRRYQLSASQIRQAATEARRLAQINRRKRILLNDLDRACRAHFAHQLGDVAQLIPPTTFSIDDLILGPNEKGKFQEVLLYAAERDAIFSEWGFGEKFPYGKGLSMLFYGPPGTGKTMSAMIIAAALGVDLFRVDLSRVLSRYVGETEKNLAKIFDEAERGRVMLLFDEADSLFTKRTDVQTSVDRYANLEVAYLLQRMENFEGITILTTNVEQLLDDAFKRRLRYRVYFPLPDANLRKDLWSCLLPRSAPIQPNIPFNVLGDVYELTGGHIKQAVIRAAVYARRDKTGIMFRHLVEAAQAECKELGMLMSDRMPKPLEEALKFAIEEENREKKNKPPTDRDKTLSAS
jgi:SpoVK/Ycf46/Vps4 family AAA+-type ATPase